MPPSEVALITKGTSVAEPPYFLAQCCGGICAIAGMASISAEQRNTRVKNVFFNGRISDLDLGRISSANIVLYYGLGNYFLAGNVRGATV